MNIAQAKQIALETILRRIGAEEDTKRRKANGSETWFKPPWRPDENTASLHVNNLKNVYFDHGTGQGGDVIKFVQEHLGGKSVSEALQWLRSTNGGEPTQKPKPRIQGQENRQEKALTEPEGFQLVKEKELTNKALINYIGTRGIPVDLVRHYCKEIYYRGKGEKNLFGIGLPNDAGGWEVRGALANLKSVVGAKDVSTIYGQTDPARLHVFEGMFDFFTKQHIKPLADNEAAMILNTGNMTATAIKRIKEEPRLQKVKDVLLWMQNDPIGERSLHEFTFALEATHNAGDMGFLYAGFKDFNQFWTDSPEARKLTSPEALKFFNDRRNQGPHRNSMPSGHN